MYLLAQTNGFKFPGHEPPYVVDISPISAGLAAITSAGSLSVFNPEFLRQGPTRTIQADKSGLKLLRTYRPDESVICTAGMEGKVRVWDLRQPASNTSPGAEFAVPGKAEDILALSCSTATNTIAMGTDSDEDGRYLSSIILWDVRSPSAPKVEYRDVHSDDVTELCFHPTQPRHLLSGSTDGLVNILDTSISDEDEVVVQAFNHGGGIHRAGFLTDTDVFALSHDERLALYSLSDAAENGAATQDFGDMRSVLECQYVANVFPKLNGAGATIGAGTCESEMFGLIHLGRDGNQWAFDKASTIGCPGAHGQDIVRGFCFLDEQQLVFSAGEDGYIRAWKPSA